MPKTLSDEWRHMLGTDWLALYEKYLHTIGNLTLTGYNPELGNKVFAEKKKIYANSNIRMTKIITEATKWGEEEINGRANYMARLATDVWKCPQGYEQLEDDEDEDLEKDYLDGKEVDDLWHSVKTKILSTCPGTTFHMTKRYGTIRAKLNQADRSMVICSFEAKTRKFRVIYNVKVFDGYMKKSNFVEDLSDRHHLGTGDYRSEIATDDDVEQLLEYIYTIWKKKTTGLS